MIIGLLTVQELKILKLIAQGLSTKEIAVILYLSYHTVESYRKSILEKTNAKNMYEALAMAFRKKWIE